MLLRNFKVLLAIPLLMFPLGEPRHPVVKPSISVAKITSLQFVKLADRHDYTAEVLQPLYNAQEAAREAAAKKAAADQAMVLKAAREAPKLSDAKLFIYNHESGNRTNAINPSSGACGLGQALPCSKMPCSLNDYNCQDTFFTNYASQRYGSWQNAAIFWSANSWW
jgi:hypothetical protein